MAEERIIVVGGGLAGLVATCELLDRGRSVTILEKEGSLGGNSSKATCGVAGPGSALQAQAGIKDDGMDLFTGQNLSAQHLIQTGPKDFEWLTKLLGVDEELVLRLTPGHGSIARTIGSKTHFPGAVVTYAVLRVLEQVASAKPNRLTIRTSAPVTKLLKTGAKVTGVEYEDEHRAKKTLLGSVVLASGGFAGDVSATSVLAQHAPHLLKLPTANDERARGDAIKIAVAVGAGTEALGKVELTPTAASVPGAEAGDSFRLVISEAICGAGAKILDAQGKRFVDELAAASVRVDAMNRNKGPFKLAIGEEKAAAVQWLVDFYTQRKIMKRYNSSSDLAREMKVPAIDPSLGTGAIFAVTISPALYSCTGGLTTGWQATEEGKVLDGSKNPIEGLFAAGEAVSSPCPRLWGISGIPLLYAVYSGRMAGRAAAGRAAAGADQPATDLRDLIISSLTAPHKVVTSEDAIEKPLEQLTQEELIAKVKDLLANGAAPAGDGGITMDEVKKHNTKEDAWIVVNGQVIDVTKWIAIHPGGEQSVTTYLGQDASDEWNMIHKPGTMEKNLVAEGGNGPVLKGKVGGGTGAAQGGGGGAPAGLTLDDVSKHSTEADCWIAVNGRAYDVTKWLQVHPGGVQSITAYAGKDATDEWNCIHKPGTIEKNLFPGNPNGAVDMGPCAGGAPVAVAAAAAVDDEAPPPEGNGGIAGPIGALIFAAINLVKMVIKTVFLTGNFKFSIDNNRKGTIRSACFLLTFTIVHVLGNFVGMIKGPLEANGEGYFFDRIAWTGGLGIVKSAPFSVVEEYLAFALLLHVLVALKRSWDISINYCINTGRWNMLLSGLTVLFFLAMHLVDIRFSSEMQYTMLRPPPNYVSFGGLLEGRVFYETDESIPLVRVRDIYTREVELFKDLGTCLLYTGCIVVFWLHMIIGWKKLVPADAMQIPKDHVKAVTWLGWIAATAIVSMYLSVVWYTYVAPSIKVEHVA